MRERAGFCSSREDPLDRASQPLAGKCIVVTRASERADSLVQELERAGAEVLRLPTMGPAAPVSGGPLNDALRQIENFDAILFVSASAVRSTFKHSTIVNKKEELRNFPGQLIGAVGPVTAQNAIDHGIRVDFVAKSGTGEGLVKELGGSLSGRKVLLPRSDRGDHGLSDALREAGALVTEVVAYSTPAPEPLDPEIVERIRRADVDVITFTSPSAFRNLSDWIDTLTLAKLSTRVRFAAIGPTTAKSIRKAGSQVEIEAAEPSVRGLTDAIVKYYQRQELYGDDARIRE